MLAFCVEFTDNPCANYPTQPTEDDSRQRMSWFIEALRKYAVFSGRSRRKEYWYFALFVVLISIVLTIIDGLIGAYERSTGRVLSSIFTLAILIPSIPYR